jgi:predicted acylesterase/phospholipase RssA
MLTDPCKNNAQHINKATFVATPKRFDAAASTSEAEAQPQESFARSSAGPEQAKPLNPRSGEFEVRTAPLDAKTLLRISQSMATGTSPADQVSLTAFQKALAQADGIAYEVPKNPGQKTGEQPEMWLVKGDNLTPLTAGLESASAPTTSTTEDNFEARAAARMRAAAQLDTKSDVVKTSKGWVKRIGSALVTGVRVLSTVPGILTAAALSKAEGLLPGKPKLSAVDWMRLRMPRAFSYTIKTAMDAVGDLTTNSAGLSIPSFFEIEEHIYKSLKPQTGVDGVKRPAEFIQQLARGDHSDPNAPLAGFVYLGEDRKEDSKELMQQWNGDTVPIKNPYPEESDLHVVWKTLQKKVSEQKPAVFIDLDGDARTYTPTEHISKRIMGSLTTRLNELGGRIQEPSTYFSWLSTRQEATYGDFNPWMEKTRPGLHKKLEKVKKRLTPPWLGGKLGIGPFTAPKNVNKAFKTMEGLASKSERGGEDLTNFADAVVSLDRDIMTATQTTWMKLLKEGEPNETREKVLNPMARSWVSLNLHQRDLAIDADAPKLKALEGPGAPVLKNHQYDRARGLGEAIDHTLAGLDVIDRRKFMATIKGELNHNLGAIQAQDARVARLLGDAYGGMDLTPVVQDRESCNEHRLTQQLDQLNDAAEHTDGLDGKDQALIRRHRDFVDWMVTSQKRYGDVDVRSMHVDCCTDAPLSVSPYFIPNSVGEVTEIGEPAYGFEQLGNPESTEVMKISRYREGGGGKGQAGPAASEALASGLTSLNYQGDDDGGNSAGSIESLLRAGGFDNKEVAKIMREMDFTEFYSDGIPNIGGTDATVGGAKQNALYSQQRMYQVMNGYLSEKLGVKGRPVLFSDLPRRYACTAVVQNHSLPEGDPLRDLIDPVDSRMIMSTENTPNFDVVAAITASTSIPGVFNSPIMEVARTEETESGELNINMHHIQFNDGGVVDNLADNAYRRSDDEEKVLRIVVPAYYEGFNEAGENVSLSTLDFDNTHVEATARQNKEFYGHTMPKVDKLLVEAHKLGYKRAVFVQNLSALDDQTQVMIQGQSEAETDQLLGLADKVELDHATADEARAWSLGMVNAPSRGKKAGAWAWNKIGDGHPLGEDNELDVQKNGARVRMQSEPERDLFSMLRGTIARVLSTNPQQQYDRLFEKPNERPG